MKKILSAIIILGITISCNSNSTNTSTGTTSTASDTITNVTNPGVGAASDDTTVKDNDSKK